nr:MAG TPA: hypothetical protein [Caudoviricetes sp.]
MQHLACQDVNDLARSTNGITLIIGHHPWCPIPIVKNNPIT